MYIYNNTTNTAIPWQLARLNIGNAMNLTSGIFTAPKDGVRRLKLVYPTFDTTTEKRRSDRFVPPSSHTLRAKQLPFYPFPGLARRRGPQILNYIAVLFASLYSVEYMQ